MARTSFAGMAHSGPALCGGFVDAFGHELGARCHREKIRPSVHHCAIRTG